MSDRDYCECCHRMRAVSWYLVDDNMECTLCERCVSSLRKQCEVDRLLVRS